MAPSVAALDSTAAGDAFNGALALALAEGRPMQEAIRFANAAGALTVTRKGVQDALPTREEIGEPPHAVSGIGYGLLAFSSKHGNGSSRAAHGAGKAKGRGQKV